MMFYHLAKDEVPSQDGIFLIRDHWNDFWEYQTMFDLAICKNLKINFIGKVKIGRKGLKKIEGNCSGHDMLQIPSEFESLNEDYFSLGQDVEYYKNLVDGFPSNYSDILKNLRDMAFDLSIFENNKNEKSLQDSIMRSVSHVTVTGQFHRIITGQAELTSYNFKYQLMNADEPIVFNVNKKRIPPTNIQVLIGRNGVGKSHLLSSMINSIIETKKSSRDGGNYFVIEEQNSINDMFANVVGISFSQFDDAIPRTFSKTEIKYYHVGFYDFDKGNREKNDYEALNNTDYKSYFEEQAKYFHKSLHAISANPHKIFQWQKAIRTLENDEIVKDMNFLDFIVQEGSSTFSLVEKEEIIKFFNDRLSSGHKIVLLLITKLVELVEEKTLIMLDEPENHLHPPLLSLMIRAISDLLSYRNGVAIIATHSPVILQEVPRDCVWIMNRNGIQTSFHRPTIETFGENTGILNREVFRLELTDASYYKIIKEVVDSMDTVEEVFNEFKGQLGTEAKALIRELMYLKNKE